MSQKKIALKQSVSAKIIINPHKNAAGKNGLYLRVRIDGVKREFNLKEYWPAENFDPVRERVLPRHPKDKDVETVNMVLDEAKSRASRIKIKYYSEAVRLSMDTFADEFEHYESRDNFIFYWMEKQHRLYNEHIIVRDTYIRHTTDLERLKAFWGERILPMSELTPDFVNKYKHWLSNKKSSNDPTNKKKLEYNTVVTALKRLQAYVNHAREDGHKIEDPFAKISLSYRAGTREVLDRDDIVALKKLMEDPAITGTEQEVLRKFLFSCYTGLRVSDSKLLHRKMIRNDHIYMTLYKGRNATPKKVEIPLVEYAAELIRGRNGLIFNSISDQKCNEWLKVIAHKAGIDKHLTFHVSRDTFATIFVELGGDPFTLKELMGHSDLDTTQIYVKMGEKRKEKLMANFNDL